MKRAIKPLEDINRKTFETKGDNRRAVVLFCVPLVVERLSVAFSGFCCSLPITDSCDPNTESKNR